MLESIPNTIMIDVIGNVIGHRLRLFGGVAHRHADAGKAQHIHVIAEIACSFDQP